MKYLLLFLLHHVLLQTSECIKLRRKWLRWNEINVTFDELIGSLESVSLKMCLAKCQETRGCAAAYVNEAKSKCELSTYYPPDFYRNMYATPRPGWTVYYIDSVVVKGARAWQSSTFADCAADNAIDGKTEEKVCLETINCGCRCAVTTGDDSRWVMELASTDYVATVLLNFRVGNSLELWRNMNFSIFVHDSFEDAKNGVDGKLCTTYMGEKISSTRIFFGCEQALYGKAVRLQDIKEPHPLYTNGIQLCEITVFFLQIYSAEL